MASGRRGRPSHQEAAMESMDDVMGTFRAMASAMQDQAMATA